MLGIELEIFSLIEATLNQWANEALYGILVVTVYWIFGVFNIQTFGFYMKSRIGPNWFNLEHVNNEPQGKLNDLAFGLVERYLVEILKELQLRSICNRNYDI